MTASLTHRARGPTGGLCMLLLAASIGCSDAPRPSPQSADASPATPAAPPSERTHRDSRAIKDALRRLGLGMGDIARGERDEAEFRAALDTHLHTLHVRGDAASRREYALLRMLALDGDMSRQDHASAARQRDEAIAAAGRADPRDALAAWLEATECRTPTVCDAAAARARLQALQPDNAAVWLLELEALKESGDAAAIDRALEAAAVAPRYDDHGQSIVAATHRALLAARLPVPDAALLHAAHRAGLFGPAPTPPTAHTALETHALIRGAHAQSPAFAGHVCGADRPMASTRRAHCMALLDTLANGPSLLDRSMGAALLMRHTRGTPAQARWREAMRRHYWRQEFVRMHGDPAFIASRMTLTEIAAIEAWQRRNGIAVEPPPGWLPRNAAMRARVLGTAPGA